MDYVKIDGKVWNVTIRSIKESFEITSSGNEGYVIKNNAVSLDRVGTYYVHEVTFEKSGEDDAEYDELYELLSMPRNDGIIVELPHGQSTITYSAYVTAGNRSVRRIFPKENKAKWGEFTVTFYPIEPQVLNDE